MILFKTILFIFLFSTPIWLYVFYIFWSLKRKRRKFWISMLDVFNQKGITVTSKIPFDKKDMVSLSGTFGNYKIMVYDSSFGSIRSRIVFTKTEIYISNYSIPNLSIARWGESNVKTGNHEFDKLFKIQSNEGDKIKELFTDKIILVFLSQKNYFTEGGLTCLDNKLIFTIPGLVNSNKKKQQYLSMLDLTLMLLNK